MNIKKLQNDIAQQWYNRTYAECSPVWQLEILQESLRILEVYVSENPIETVVRELVENN